MCLWGQKAFAAYLGENTEAWKAWDPVELVKTAKERLPLLVDQGESDEFLAGQVRPELLSAACKAAGHTLTLRMRPGYRSPSVGRGYFSSRALSMELGYAPHC